MMDKPVAAPLFLMEGTLLVSAAKVEAAGQLAAPVITAA